MDYGWQTVLRQVPSKSNCYRIITLEKRVSPTKKISHASLAKTAALKAFEQTFYMQCGKYRNLNIDGFFEFHCRVFYPSIRSDIDNSLKCLLDCLQMTKSIKNDNLCVKVVAEKFVDKVNPRVEFKIVTVE